jgi:hypothetical protein
MQKHIIIITKIMTTALHYTEIDITVREFINITGNVPIKEWIKILVILVAEGFEINISQRKQIIDFIRATDPNDMTELNRMPNLDIVKILGIMTFIQIYNNPLLKTNLESSIEYTDNVKDTMTSSQYLEQMNYVLSVKRFTDKVLSVGRQNLGVDIPPHYFKNDEKEVCIMFYL